MDTCWLKTSSSDDLFAVTVILSALPMLSETSKGEYENDMKSILSIYLVWVEFEIDPYTASAVNVISSSGPLFMHWIWTVTEPLPTVAVKSLPADIGRRYAVVARIIPREILSKL